jgi:DNA transformation protein
VYSQPVAVNNDYLQFVLEQLAGLGSTTSRRMFGGAGLYCGELFFGLIAEDTLYFRVNDRNRPDYQSRNMAQFRPYPDRPHVSMSYYAVPVDVLEDPEELVLWARRSVAVALESPKPRPPSGRKPKSPRRRTQRG